MSKKSNSNLWPFQLFVDLITEGQDGIPVLLLVHRAGCPVCKQGVKTIIVHTGMHDL